MKKILLAFLLLTGYISNGQIINTVAGTGTASFTGDGGAANAATMNVPAAVCTDGAGNLYIADYSNNRVRKVNSAGIITTVAGNGTAGYGGDGGQATAAAIHNPIGLAIDGSGNLYISDNVNNRIRKVNTTGVITTFAGNGTTGAAGDGGAATAAAINSPSRIYIDAGGNLYIPDYGNNKVRKVNTSGIITTVAGTGAAGAAGDGGAATAAQLHGPSGVTVDASGNLLIAELTNNKIRKVTTAGIISTFAGTGVGGYSGDAGPASAAQLNGPIGLTIDATGNIYIGDFNNHRIRKINTAGIISTFAGTGVAGFSGDGGSAVAAQLHNPSGIFTDGTCNLFIADNANNKVRGISLFPPADAGTVTGPTRVCVAGAIVLTDGTTGGAWTSSNTGVALVGSTGSVTGVSTGTAQISYTVNNGCNSASATWTVTVDASVTAGSISGIPVFCQGSNTILSDAVAGGTWSSSNTSIAIVSSGTVTGVAAGNAVITYTVTNGCGTAIAIRPITVNPLANAGIITGPASVCAGSNITLHDAAAGGLWSSNSEPTATIGSTSGIVAGVLAGTVIMSYTVTNGCGPVSATLLITVNPLPNAGTIAGLSTICAGLSQVYINTAPGGFWTTSGTNAIITTTGTAYGVAVGTDTIKYTVTNGCGTAIATRAVTINPHSYAGVISGPPTVCAGGVANFTSTVTIGVWSSAGALVSMSSAGVATGVNVGVDTIRYTNNNGCGIDVATKIVTVITVPDPGTVTGPDVVCAGAIITLTPSVTGGAWVAANSNAFVSTGGAVLGVVAGSDDLYYIVTNTCGRDTAAKSVTITSCTNGVADIKDNEHSIDIYPNPTAGICSIQSPVNATLTLLSIEGKILTRYTIQKGTSSLTLPDHFASGIYICRYDGEDGSVRFAKLMCVR